MLRKETNSLKKRRGQLYYLLFNQLLRYSLQSETVVFGIPVLTRIVGQCVDNTLTSVFSVSAQIKYSAVKVAGLKQSSKSLLKDKYSRNTEGF